MKDVYATCILLINRWKTFCWKVHSAQSIHVFIQWRPESWCRVQNRPYASLSIIHQVNALMHTTLQNILSVKKAYSSSSPHLQLPQWCIVVTHLSCLNLFMTEAKIAHWFKPQISADFISWGANAIICWEWTMTTGSSLLRRSSGNQNACFLGLNLK